MPSRRLGVAVAINVLLTVVQIVGGLLAGSLALVADALHNLSDAASLGVALGARRIARRPPDERRTFGYRRAETIGALMNLTALVVIGGYILFEAVSRFFEREPVEGWTVVIVAGVALLVDVATAWLTHTGARHSHGIRAAFVHNLADAAASVAVIVSGTLIILFDWHWTDLAAAVLVAGYTIWQGLAMMPRVVGVLMQSAPEGVDPRSLAEDLRAVDGVEDVHHVHVWMLDEHERSLEAHVVTRLRDLGEIERVKREVKTRLRERHGVAHSTLEFEVPASSADTTPHHRSVIPRS